MRARPLTPDEIARVREYFDSGRHGRYTVRDRAIFELGINCGLRVSELCALKVGQVWQYGQVVGRLELTETKGGKHRAVPLNRIAAQAVRELIAWKARPERLWPEDPLFRSQKGGHLDRRHVDWIWQHVKRQCRITGKATTHSWRRTFANTLQELGVPLSVIQHLLGHSKVVTTQVYLSVTASQAEEAVSRLAEYHELSNTTDFHPQLTPERPQRLRPEPV